MLEGDLREITSRATCAEHVAMLAAAAVEIEDLRLEVQAHVQGRAALLEEIQTLRAALAGLEASTAFQLGSAVIRGAGGPVGERAWLRVENERLRAKIAELEHERKTLRTACMAIVTDEAIDPCWYDHHGDCQAHGLQPKGECYMELIRAALAAPARRVGEG